jgi:hypothetical protein
MNSLDKNIIKFFLIGKCISCNGINITKQCVCICDQDHPYDPFVAGMLVDMCPKTDKSIVTYLHE